MAEPDNQQGIQADPPAQADEQIQAEPPVSVRAEVSVENPTQVRWLIFALTCAVSWLLYLHRYSWGVIRLEVKGEYHLTDSQLGWLDSLFQVTYALGQVPGGLAGDMYGPRLVLSLSVLLWSIMLASMAWVPGVGGFTPIRLGFGLAQAAAFPNVSKITRNWFPLSVRTTVQGIVASLSGRAGGACAPLIVGTFLMAGIGLGWRGAMLAVSSVGVALAVAFWLLFRNTPGDHPWCNAAERNLIDDSPPGKKPPMGRPRFYFSTANVVTVTGLLVYSIGSTFVDQLFVNWVPQFLEEGKGLSKAQTGVYASLPLVGGALGGAFGGMLNDWMIRRTGSRRWGRTTVAMSGKLIAAALLALAVTLPDGRAVAILLLACKFFTDWGNATIWGASTDVSGRAVGTIFGVFNMAGAAAGFAANLMIGGLKQGNDWEPAFFLLAGVFVASGLSWLFINSDCRLLAEDQPAEQQPA